MGNLSGTKARLYYTQYQINPTQVLDQNNQMGHPVQSLIISDLALVVVADALLELVHGDELADVLDDEAALLHRLLDEQAPPAAVRHGHLKFN